MRLFVYFLLFMLSTLIFSCTKTRRNSEGRNNRTSARITTPKHESRGVTARVRPSIPASTQSNVLAPTEIFRKYNPAVFMIYTTDGVGVFQGSGFFISADGLAVSNYHVFKGTTVGYEVIKLSDGRQYKIAEVIAKNESEDYILFRIKGSFCYIPLSHHQCSVGEKVYAIGSPRGLENTFSSGEISQIREDNYIQISCPIDHGSSGGALLNAFGEVIGITTGGNDESGANLNFAKDIRVLRQLDY